MTKEQNMPPSKQLLQTAENDTERTELKRIFRDTRMRLPQQPEPQRMVPTVYANTGGIVPFGNPMVLNANIAVAAVNGFVAPFGLGPAPYQMNLPAMPTVAPPARPVRKLF